MTKVLVIGAGTLGRQIARHIALKGMTVGLIDISKKALDEAKEALTETTRSNPIRFYTWLDEVSFVPELVIETVVEDLKVKRAVLRSIQAHPFWDKKTLIVATNTSNLLPSHIARGSLIKGRVCALHFHNLDVGATVVDIMAHRGTDADVVPRLTQFVHDLDLDPLVLKREHSSYVYNNLLNALLDSSIKLAILGVATEEQIDKSWLLNTKMPLGPFGILDLIGLDTALAITKRLALTQPSRWLGVRYLERWVKKGKIGIKSGEGFYKYPGPSYAELAHRVTANAEKSQ